MNFFATRMVVFGVAFGIALTFGLHAPSGDTFGTAMAISLAVIGAIYLGALLNPAVAGNVIKQELAAALITFAFVGAGVLIHVLWLVPGYIFHGLWDWAHHEGRFGANIVSWYPPFCASIDITMGLILLAWWLW